MSDAVSKPSPATDSVASATAVDRRIHDRREQCLNAQLEILGQSDPLLVPAVVTNLSAGGAQIRTQRHTCRRGGAVRLIFAGTVRSGEVCYSAQEGAVQVMGIRFAPRDS